MDEFLKELLPTGPIRHALVVAILMGWLFPSARSLWYKVKHREERVERILKLLEIIKLRCEIEATGKGAAVPPSLLSAIDEVLATESKPPLQTAPPPALSPLRRFFLGMLGALFVPIARGAFAMLEAAPEESRHFFMVSRTPFFGHRF